MITGGEVLYTSQDMIWKSVLKSLWWSLASMVGLLVYCYLSVGFIRSSWAYPTTFFLAGSGVVTILLGLAHYRLTRPIIYLGSMIVVATMFAGLRSLINIFVIPALFIMTVPFGNSLHEFFLTAAFIALPGLVVATFLFFMTKAVNLVRAVQRDSEYEMV